MIIVRLLSPEPFWLAKHHQLYSGVGADIVMESITLKTTQSDLRCCSRSAIDGTMELVARLRKIQPFGIRCNTQRAAASFADSANCLILCGICAGGEDAIGMTSCFEPSIQVLARIKVWQFSAPYSHRATKQHPL